MKGARVILLRIITLCLIGPGLYSYSLAHSDQRSMDEFPINQAGITYPSDTLTDPNYQDKKKSSEKAKKKSEKKEEEAGILDTVKEMFHNAFDYLYGTEEIKDEKESGKKSTN